MEPLRCINWAAWSFKLLLMTVWAYQVDCSCFCALLRIQHYDWSPCGWYGLPSGSAILYLCCKSEVSTFRHQWAIVAWIFQIGISQNIKYSIRSGFLKSSHIILCEPAWENRAYVHKIHLGMHSYYITIVHIYFLCCLTLYMPIRFPVKNCINTISVEITVVYSYCIWQLS